MRKSLFNYSLYSHPELEISGCNNALADGVNEGRYLELELGAEYCEQEPEIPNTEPELPEDFEDVKFNLIL
jgi:hypothetical protein